MLNGCWPFEYGRKDGTILTEQEFYLEHQDITITPAQKERMEQNLERQCSLALKEFGNKEYIRLQGFCKTFIFKDSETQELYLKPLEIDIRVFFRKVTPILLIYDLRMAT